MMSSGSRVVRRAPQISRAGHDYRIVLGLLTAVVGGLATGCAPSHGQMIKFLRSHETTVAAGEYRLMPPDVITLHSGAAPEIDGITQRLRPDGKVALRLLGEVHLAGLTTTAAARKLEKLLAKYYVEPQVVVEIADYRSQQFYVFGEVGLPGPKPFTGRDTLLHALAEAQPTFLAWQTQIRVVRPSHETAEREVIVVNLEKMVRDGDSTNDILLQPGDIIEVPPTPLAWLGHRVREVLYPVAPALNTYNAPAQAIETQEIYEGRRRQNVTLGR